MLGTASGRTVSISDYSDLKWGSGRGLCEAGRNLWTPGWGSGEEVHRAGVGSLR